MNYFVKMLNADTAVFLRLFVNFYEDYCIEGSDPDNCAMYRSSSKTVFINQVLIT